MIYKDKKTAKEEPHPLCVLGIVAALGATVVIQGISDGNKHWKLNSLHEDYEKKMKLKNRKKKWKN